MRLLSTIVALMCFISMSARDDFNITEVKVYKDNVMTKTALQIAKLKSRKMGEEDKIRLQTLIDEILPTKFSPVSPDPGGVFCIMTLTDGETYSIRITGNVLVMKKDGKGQESYEFYTPRDAKHIDLVRDLLLKFAEDLKKE